MIGQPLDEVRQLQDHTLRWDAVADAERQDGLTPSTNLLFPHVNVRATVLTPASPTAITQCFSTAGSDVQRRLGLAGTGHRVVDEADQKQDEVRIVDVIVAADQISRRAGHDEWRMAIGVGR